MVFLNSADTISWSVKLHIRLIKSMTQYLSRHPEIGPKPWMTHQASTVTWPSMLLIWSKPFYWWRHCCVYLLCINDLFVKGFCTIIKMPEAWLNILKIQRYNCGKLPSAHLLLLTSWVTGPFSPRKFTVSSFDRPSVAIISTFLLVFLADRLMKASIQ